MDGVALRRGVELRPRTAESEPLRSTLRSVATPVLVSLAYYVGAQIGFALKFLPVTPSVLWPPNSILTATLLLAPRRRWWIYLLAALPAHLVVQLGAGRPASLALALFATNCSEALLAASGLRAFSDRPTRFDTLRRVAVLIVAAGFVAPFVASFADAAAVAWLRGEPYWFVWRSRFLSGVLAELTLMPAIVMVVSAGPAWIRDASPRRRAEAGLLAVGLVAVGIVVLAESAEGPGAFPGSAQTSLAFFLPCLLWAAVRFGPGGVSLSLLMATLVAIWADIRGVGPFTALPPSDGVVALQISLGVATIPLMVLAGVIEERRQARGALEERLRFQELLSHLSGAFVHLPSHEVDRAIETWLQRLGEFLQLDRITLHTFAGDTQALAVSHSWAAAESAPIRPIAGRDFHSAVQRLVGETPAPSPAAATLGKEALRQAGMSSVLVLQLVAGGRVFGTLAFISIAEERAWPEELVQRLRLVAEVFANSLARKETEDALRASELMNSAILASLTSSVAVLDREGYIIAVNESWRRYARGNGTGVGDNYLEGGRQAALPCAPAASEALAGVQGVLDRSRSGFAFEYLCPTPDGERWFAMSVVPLNLDEGGAVVAHTDVTERKRAEIEAERSRQELAHFTRVSTMGELTASLAHELNQPLTGILANAQAARRFLDTAPLDLDELRSILTDIIDDDKRAAEVILRVRDLLRKGHTQLRLLDLNTLIRDVTKLLSSDAVIRNVTLRLGLAAESLVVSGDRVQLQQVVLNLLLNAMDAMADCAGDDRTLVVQTERGAAQTVCVSVRDAGTGLPEGAQELIFDPFYTTKPTGMGMGLAIARSIIEAHGGVIEARNNPTRGATFHFALPLAAEKSS